MISNTWIRVVSPLCIASLFACSDSGGGPSIFGNGDGISTAGGDDGGNGNAGDDDGTDETAGDGGNDDGDGGGPKLDVLFEDDDGDGGNGGDEGIGSDGCKAIDFLFVIDNSGSMGDNQQNLINSFPGFIAKIQETVADVDSYHIMVAKTDSGWNDCQIECGFFPFLCQFGDINGCDGAPSACDETLGAGVNFPIGDDASNQFCDLTGGQRFITPAEPFDQIGNKFTCIASVGTDGDSSERPMSALTQAVSPSLNGPGGCNSGFLRDDAILVITIITDEEDDDSQGTPNGWYQNIIAQKAGDGSGVVVLGLINDTDSATPVCPAQSQDPAKIRDFITSFPNNIMGSVCAPNYAPFFEQAVDLIDTTCSDFEPVG